MWNQATKLWENHGKSSNMIGKLSKIPTEMGKNGFNMIQPTMEIDCGFNRPTLKHAILVFFYMQWLPQRAHEYAAAREAVKSSWQTNCFQALVELTSEFQGPKTTWKIHSFKRLVEFLAKCQTLKTGWQIHSLQGLVEFMAKC